MKEQTNKTLQISHLPFPQLQKHRHPCVYHVVVSRTFAVGNVLLPQHPSFNSPAARLNAIALLLAITCGQKLLITVLSKNN